MRVFVCLSVVCEGLFQGGFSKSTEQMDDKCVSRNKTGKSYEISCCCVCTIVVILVIFRWIHIHIYLDENEYKYIDIV